MNRSAARELAFKMLYEQEIQKELTEKQIENFIENNEIKDESTKEYIKDIIEGVNKNSKEIINLITINLKTGWEIDRISKISIALLKLAIHEIEYSKIPFKVVINEVVELSKKYAEETSHSFINGVLASIVKEKN